MADKSAWSGFGTGLAQGAAQAGVNAGVNSLFGLIGSAIQMKNQKKLMALQQQYQRDNFDMQSAYNNWFAENGARLSKYGLQKAGLSPAVVQGNGFSPATASINPQTVSTTGAPNPFGNMNFDVNQGMLTAAQIRNINADTANKEANTEYQKIVNMFEPEARRLGVEAQELANEYQNFKNEVEAYQIPLTQEQLRQLTIRGQQLDIDMQYYADMKQQEYQAILWDNNIKEESWNKLVTENQYLADLLLSEIAKNRSSAAKDRSDIRVNEKRIEELTEIIHNWQLQNGQLEPEAILSGLYAEYLNSPENRKRVKKSAQEKADFTLSAATEEARAAYEESRNTAEITEGKANWNRNSFGWVIGRIGDFISECGIALAALFGVAKGMKKGGPSGKIGFNADNDRRFGRIKDYQEKMKGLGKSYVETDVIRKPKR